MTVGDLIDQLKTYQSDREVLLEVTASTGRSEATAVEHEVGKDGELYAVITDFPQNSVRLTTQAAPDHPDMAP